MGVPLSWETTILTLYGAGVIVITIISILTILLLIIIIMVINEYQYSGQYSYTGLCIYMYIQIAPYALLYTCLRLFG